MLSSIDGVKVALGRTWMTVKAARKVGSSGEPRYVDVSGPFLLGSCAISDCPITIWLLSPGEGGMLYDAVGVDCKNRATNDTKGTGVSLVYGLRDKC